MADDCGHDRGHLVFDLGVLPRAQLARGREAGAAGGVGVLLVDAAGVLPPAVYASPCVAA